jgi:hypothetical protein
MCPELSASTSATLKIRQPFGRELLRPGLRAEMLSELDTSGHSVGTLSELDTSAHVVGNCPRRVSSPDNGEPREWMQPWFACEARSPEASRVRTRVHIQLYMIFFVGCVLLGPHIVAGDSEAISSRSEISRQA